MLWVIILDEPHQGISNEYPLHISPELVVYLNRLPQMSRLGKEWTELK